MFYQVNGICNKLFKMNSILHWSQKLHWYFLELFNQDTLLERIYNPITAMGFSAMFTFQLDNTKS